jgi:hypothetical protein
MKFDLGKHLKSHAYHFKNYQYDSKKENLHFAFSFLDLHFLQKDVEKIMSALLSDLREPTQYRVANGKRRDKDGNEVQKYTNRKIDLTKVILAEAIHLKGPNGEDTMPHIHFIIDKKARLGRRYSLLKKHIIEVAERYELIPHFDQLVEHNPMAVAELGKSTKRLTWAWQRMSNKELKIELDRYGVENAIKILKDYALKTNNLGYYIKSMQNLKRRLNSLRLDIYYEGHNLKDSYPIPLQEQDMEVINIINRTKFSQKDIKPFINHPIMRDYIRYSANKSHPYIISALKEQTNLLQNIKKNQKAVKSYIALNKKLPKKQKSKMIYQKKEQQLDPKRFKKDLLLSVDSSISQKNLVENMNISGYFKFTLKRKKGAIVGCAYQENGKRVNMDFIDLGVNWKTLQIKLKSNKKLPKLPTIDIKREYSPINDLNQMSDKPDPTSVKIYYNSEKIAQNKEKNRLKQKLKRIKDEQRKRARDILEKVTLRVEREIQHFNERVKILRERIDREKNRESDLRAKIGDVRERIIQFEPLRVRIDKFRDRLGGFRKKVINYKNLLISIKHDIKYKDLKVIISWADQYNIPHDRLSRDFDELKNQKYLDLSNLQLDHIPEELASLTSLKELYINDNNLTQISDAILDMKLDHFSAKRNKFSHQNKLINKSGSTYIRKQNDKPSGGGFKP